MKYFAALLTLLATFTAATTSADTPYAGMEIRTIKALSDREISDYRSGSGMGLALAAELNHYPGPRHVLDLADDLQLRPEQLHRTREIFDEMRQAAITIGERIIDAEARLDSLFADGRITPDSLEREVRTIARLKGQLRARHLQAHLAMAAILSPEQIGRYSRLRGYGERSPQPTAPGNGPHGHRH